ncbi:hypothetical protein EIP86_010122 [Pleurotus ostreatoroseus]|nr:hypothetical protein EIP86_010122 [Pleurotus ostreatoroseus]
MDDDMDDDNIDLEELQAQIDLSMAETQSLVASWVQSTASASTSTSKVDRARKEQEIEELLRRPSRCANYPSTPTLIFSDILGYRLGVGAAAPAATNIRSIESVKLKGKLAGKKRQREEDPIVIPSNSDEEEESRAGAIKKKARLDPFESKGKGKGKKKAQANPPPKAQHPVTEKIKPERKELLEVKAKAAAAVAASPVAEAQPATSPRITSLECPAHKKRKKKNKNKTVVTTAVKDDPRLKKESLAAFEKDDAVVEVIMVEDSPEPTSPKPKKARLKTPERAHSPSADVPTLLGVPLLNLDGPPPAVETTPTKKKRRRKKKKKADRSERPRDDAMDVDDQEVVIIIPSDTEEHTEPYHSKCRVL